jgi:hypothetical protein
MIFMCVPVSKLVNALLTFFMLIWNITTNKSLVKYFSINNKVAMNNSDFNEK